MMLYHRSILVVNEVVIDLEIDKLQAVVYADDVVLLSSEFVQSAISKTFKPQIGIKLR